MRTRLLAWRRLPLLVATGVVLVLTAGCSPTQVGPAGSATSASTATTGAPTPAPTTTPTTTPAPTSATPTTTPARPSPTTTARPKPAPRILLRPGQTSAMVRELQARLRQIRWYSGDVTGYYGTRTTAAVRGFQAKRGLPATGVLDERTWQRLLAMTHEPTADELNNVRPKPAALSWDVDQRCLTGRVVCISKSTRELTWVLDGVPQYQMDVRFGSELLPTREGTFAITWKKIDVISTLYHTPMPYSMFFSGGQAIHYSSNFARLGYNGSSHGCVNVRDWDGIVRLYNDTRVGDKVVVHW